LVPKGFFDQSIFEGMEGDDDRAPVGVQSLRKGTGEKGLQVFKFVVDGDPQRLKDARGGMRLGRSAAGSVQGVVDGSDQLGCRANRLAGPATHDRPRD
jgi:hypothetical protein